jgi:tRNA nucleotidyltransferase (CCA-adding enzyme)
MTRRPLPQPVRIYRVGGSVRDELLGRPDADRDFVVVGATPEMLLASGFRPVGRDFPVFLHPDTQDEHALARTERKHGRGYRGFEFFASPDVTLEEDLQRRDLTINAMARGDDGVLVDPFGGRADLEAGVLRHVSPAFAEDPLRVLRVARFAARFDFAVAPETEALMRAIVRSGELATLAPERVWQEWARGLMEAHPSRMLAVLRRCGALEALLPEVDAVFGVARVRDGYRDVDAGVHVAQALDAAARRGLGLQTRFAVLAHDLCIDDAAPQLASRLRQRNVRAALALAARLRAPVECRDAALVLARWRDRVNHASALTPAALLDLLQGIDALRRPERLAALLDACAIDAVARATPPQTGADVAYAPATVLRDALRAVAAVDAGAEARRLAGTTAGALRGDAIAGAVRAARLRALRAWRRTLVAQAAGSRQPRAGRF